MALAYLFQRDLQITHVGVVGWCLFDDLLDKHPVTRHSLHRHDQKRREIQPVAPRVAQRVVQETAERLLPLSQRRLGVDCLFVVGEVIAECQAKIRKRVTARAYFTRGE